MARQFAERPGNYLAFFSSYAYLQSVLDEFRAAHPQIPVWVQSRQMDEGERQAFLDRFAAMAGALALLYWVAPLVKASTCLVIA